MTFYSRNNPPPSVATPRGRRERERKELHIDAYGNKSLRVTQTIDQYEVIQSFSEETKIENILNAYERGDVSVLQKREGVFFDATEMPSTLAGAYEILRKAEAAYNALDPDDRASVGSFNDFLNSCTNWEFNRIAEESIVTTTAEGGEVNA